MLIEKERVNTEQFIIYFNKKFMSFCSKLPILVSYIIAGDSITVYKHDSNTKERKVIFEFKLDFNESPKTNIFNIKQKLIPYFPHVTQISKKEIIASKEEVNQLLSLGKITFDDVTENGYFVKRKIPWLIDKVVLVRDEFFIRNLETHKYFRHKTKIPITKFLREIDNLSEEEKWDKIIQKSYILNEVIKTIYKEKQ